MSSFLNALSPLVTAGTQAATGALAGQQQADQTNQKNLLTQIDLLRQQHKQEQDDALHASTIGLQGFQGQEYSQRIKQQQQQMDQETYLHSPEFQTALEAAKGGDKQAKALVMARIAGHPSAASVREYIEGPKKQFKATQDKTGLWTSMDEATGLDVNGKQIQGMVPRDPNATKDSFQLVQDAKSGQWYRVRKEGPEGPVGAFAPQGKGGAVSASAQTMSALSRMKQVSADLASRIPQLESYEDPKSEYNITKAGMSDIGLGGMADVTPSAEAHGFPGLFNNGVGALGAGLAKKQLGSTPAGQAYRNYTQGGKAVGLGLTEILPRPNNALLGIERDLSITDPGAYNPILVQNVQQRRRTAKKAIDAILQMNPQFVESMLKQDPDWLNNTLASAIKTGALPQGEAATSAAPSGGSGKPGSTYTLSNGTVIPIP
jgi:hypothetical protein